MEFINKIELRGVVGSVKVSEVGGAVFTHFSLVTEYSYQSGSGEFVVDMMWWNCSLNARPEIKKGDIAHVVGRIRQRMYVASDYSDRPTYDVVVQAISIEGHQD